jgi:hypothetical protein
VLRRPAQHADGEVARTILQLPPRGACRIAHHRGAGAFSPAGVEGDDDLGGVLVEILAVPVLDGGRSRIGVSGCDLNVAEGDAGTEGRHYERGEIPGVPHHAGRCSSCIHCPLGMTPIDWDVEPRDWARPESSYITAKLLAAGPGHVLCCHYGGGDAHRRHRLRERFARPPGPGLRFVTLSKAR